ncbi:MAG TPA: MarR family transcriptional regulator [Steroidobacteraceae bacterium]|nr:MarR family transcriptional regulator [Steroidobacteraceae bacterium]
MKEKDALRKLKRFDLLSAPGHLLRRNHQRSLDIFTRTVGDDVTRQQIGTLLALHRKPGASQRDLVDATGIDKSTLKEMLGRLVERGWVRRERDSNDSRAWTMQLTPAGLSLLVERIDKVEAAQREILAPLPVRDRVIFLRYLRKLAGLGSGTDGG